MTGRSGRAVVGFSRRFAGGIARFARFAGSIARFARFAGGIARFARLFYHSRPGRTRDRARKGNDFRHPPRITPFYCRAAGSADVDQPADDQELPCLDVASRTYGAVQIIFNRRTSRVARAIRLLHEGGLSRGVLGGGSIGAEATLPQR